MLVWEGAALPNLRRLRVLVDGGRAKPPLTHIILPVRNGRQRNILALKMPMSASSAPAIEIAEVEGRILASSGCQADPPVYPDELDVASLMAGLAGAERARLVRFLLEVCSSLFGVSADPRFVAILRTVLLKTASASGQLIPRCALFGDHLLCEGLVPAAIGERLSAVLLTGGVVSRIEVAPRLLPAPDK